MSEIIYGIHAVQMLLEREPSCIEEIFVLNRTKNRRISLLVQKIKAHGMRVHLVDRRFLNRRSATKNIVHQGIIACIKSEKTYQENYLLNLITEKQDNLFLLILDGITDPHNLGACLRSADAAGVHAVIVPRKRSACLNAVVKKVACGAVENVPLIRVINLASTMRLLRKENIRIVGTAEKADRTLYQNKMIGRIALVMGSEDKGIRRLTREHCDELIRIPMMGIVSSLNVSVATGICLFEVLRQRG